MCEHHKEMPPPTTVDLAFVLSSLLSDLKITGIVAPCDHCGYPAVRNDQRPDGHLLCWDCKQEMEIEEVSHNG